MYDANSPEWQEGIRKSRAEEAEKAKRDLETNRKRRLTITLTDAQLAGIQSVAEAHNVSVDEILANYIADLTRIHSNGSDERERARDYFERTHLSWAYKDDQDPRTKRKKKRGI
ncbi:MAG: hypothetical protein K0Q73_5809 [Paenibacillus sp.]|nr:hypothetical protein [Paenibacillus sp.]